jgi:hypothetical protein
MGGQSGRIRLATQDTLEVADNDFFAVFGGAQEAGGDRGYRCASIEPGCEVGEACGVWRPVQRETVEVGDRFVGRCRGWGDAVFEVLEIQWG